MWNVRRIFTREVILTLSDTADGRVPVDAIWLDDAFFANAAQLTSWNAERFQPMVCSDCGYEGCDVGGWLTLRRLGNRVAMIPDFAAMLEGELALREYGPPEVVLSRGCPVLTSAQYADLSDRIPALLPPLREIQPLSGRELAWVLQLEAPGSILGELPRAPSLLRAQVLAAAEHDLCEAVERVNTFLSSLICSRNEVDVLPTNGARPLTLTLDTSPPEIWAPLATSHTRDFARLSPDLLCGLRV